MSILANNLYVLSQIAMARHGDLDCPLPNQVRFSDLKNESIRDFTSLVTERFGRTWEGDLRQGDLDIRMLAKKLEGLPQSTSPEIMHTFRERDLPDTGMVIFFPGQHGMARAFHRFADLIDDRHSVLGFDYDGLDERIGPSKSMVSSVECFHRRMLERHAGLLDRLAENGGEVVLFGFCLGGCYAHEFARRLLQEHDLKVRLVIFDGHPAEWYSVTGTRELFRKTKRALKQARTRGSIDRLLVRQGRRQIHLLGKHRSGKVDVPALLLRSSSVHESWGLSKESWTPHVGSCRQVDLPDLSHLDLFQRRQEKRIFHYLEPGFSEAC